MLYKSVILCKNRIFPYFQKKVKKFKQYNSNINDNNNKKNNYSEKNE